MTPGARLGLRRKEPKGDGRVPVTSLEEWAPWPGEQMAEARRKQWQVGETVGLCKALGLQVLNEAESKDVCEVCFSDFVYIFKKGILF